MNDPVSKPAHYTYATIEVIDAIEAWELNFHLGNVVKYVARAGRKGPATQDLQKARWYLDRAIGLKPAASCRSGTCGECSGPQTKCQCPKGVAG